MTGGRSAGATAAGYAGRRRSGIVSAWRAPGGDPKRVALRDILRYALAAGTARRGASPVGAGRRAVPVELKMDSDGPRADAGDRRRRHALGGGLSPTAWLVPTATPGTRRRVSPRWPWPTRWQARRSDRAREVGHADGAGRTLLVRHRAGRRGRRRGRGTGLPARQVRQRGRIRCHMLAATDPAASLRNDLYDRDPARRWADGPVVVVGDAAHPMRPHLGQGGCQALEDAAVLAAMVDLRPRPAGRVRGLRVVPPASGGRGGSASRGPSGRLVNLRPPVLSAVASRASDADAGGTGDPAPGHNRRGHGAFRLPHPLGAGGGSIVRTRIR